MDSTYFVGLFHSMIPEVRPYVAVRGIIGMALGGFHMYAFIRHKLPQLENQ